MKRTISAFIAGSIFVAAAFASQVGARRENQQDRIAQGVKSGSLTAGGTARLEKRESAINQEVRTDRGLNGGKLTGQERDREWPAEQDEQPDLSRQAQCRHAALWQ